MIKVQESFTELIKEITALQWVRESLPTYSKNYRGLKQKLEKQRKLKEFSENELQTYKIEKDNGRTYNDMVESVKFYDQAIEQIQSQIDEAESMLNELTKEKEKLDNLCEELHLLYDKVILVDLTDSDYIVEQQLKRDVNQLSNELPIIKSKIENYTLAQFKLYQARELIDTAIKLIPGAYNFMNRQVIINLNQHNRFELPSTPSEDILDKINSSEVIVNSVYILVKDASNLCDDVPTLPDRLNNIDDIILVLTHYRDIKLKIEYILRTQLNPRLHSFQNQLASTNYQYEQRLIEWIDHQIISLESFLRVNGCLENENLDRELSRLRVGSRAAKAAIVSDIDVRVAVDEALDINLDQGILPEYNQNDITCIDNTRSSISTSSIDSNTIVTDEIYSSPPPIFSRCDDLPSYYRTCDLKNDLLPPAYTR